MPSASHIHVYRSDCNGDTQTDALSCVNSVGYMEVIYHDWTTETGKAVL